MGWTSLGPWIGILIVLVHLALPTWQQKPKPTIAQSLADSLEVRYRLLSNLEFDLDRNTRVPHSKAILSIKNVGQKTIPGSGYSFLFCHENRLFPLSFNGRTRLYVGPYDSLFYLREEYQLKYHKGCMYELVAKRGKPLKRNEVLDIQLSFEPYIVSKASIFPNYYVKDRMGNYALLKNTRKVKDFASGFDKMDALMRAPLDIMSVPPSIQDLYQPPRQSAQPTTQKLLFTPQPRSIEFLPIAGTFKVSAKQWWIDNDNSESKFFVKYLSDLTKIGLKNSATNPNANIIFLSVNKLLAVPPEFENPDEFYNLTVLPTSIRLEARSANGLAMGVQTLIQLIQLPSIRPLIISDSPKYSFRGLMLDIASRFYDLPSYAKLLKLMGHNKLNKLTINLWNNLGARLEIPGIPQLTDIGGKQCIDDEEKKCIYIQHGSLKDGRGAGNGYFTQKQYMQFLRYARYHGIEVIPSLNMGMNARAVIVSMKQYIDKLTGKQAFDFYDEKEPGFSVEYADSSINPCLQGAVQFFDKIILHLKQYHSKIDIPLRVHLAGSVDMGQIRHSNHCIPTEVPPLLLPKTLNEIKLNYTKKLVEILVKNDVLFSGGDEFFTLAVPERVDNELYDTNTAFSKRRYPGIKDPYVEVRDFAHEKKSWKRSGNFLAAGFKVIMSPYQLTDFHMAEYVDPNKPGDSNARTRVIKPEQVHKIVPKGICCNIHGGGFPFNCQANEPDFDCRTLANLTNNIAGSQIHMDTAKILNVQDFFKLLGRRSYFFGEQMWYGSDWENFFTVPKPVTQVIQNRTIQFLAYEPNVTIINNDFDEKLYKFGERELWWLRRNKYPVEMPLPGAIFENNTFKVSHQYPKFDVDVFNASSNTWHQIGMTDGDPSTSYLDIAHELIKFRLSRFNFNKEYTLNKSISRNDTMRGQVASEIQQLAKEQRERILRIQQIREANFREMQQRALQFQRQQAARQGAQQGGTQSGQQAGQGGQPGSQGGQQQPQMPWQTPFFSPMMNQNRNPNANQNRNPNANQNRNQNPIGNRNQMNQRVQNNNPNMRQQNFMG